MRVFVCRKWQPSQGKKYFFGDFVFEEKQESPVRIRKCGFHHFVLSMNKGLHFGRPSPLFSFVNFDKFLWIILPKTLKCGRSSFFFYIQNCFFSLKNDFSHSCKKEICLFFLRRYFEASTNVKKNKKKT